MLQVAGQMIQHSWRTDFLYNGGTDILRSLLQNSQPECQWCIKLLLPSECTKSGIAIRDSGIVRIFRSRTSFARFIAEKIADR